MPASRAPGLRSADTRAVRSTTLTIAAPSPSIEGRFGSRDSGRKRTPLHERGDAERDVDEEDEAPAGAEQVGVDERAAEDRPQDGTAADHGAEQAEGLAELLVGKESRTIPKPCGIIAAAQRPWSSRNAISVPGDQASEHSAELSVKPATPSRNMRRRPKMSPRRAPVTSPIAKVSA